MTPHTTRRRAAWAARCADAVLGPVARAVGLWWGFPWCPVEPDECGRVHDVEEHLHKAHRQVAA